MGWVTNPGFHVIQALVEFFAVDPYYFFESDEMKSAFAIDNQEQDAFLDQVVLSSQELNNEAK